ncbi:hypothetical protein HYX13_02535 [Candidatus Woesearchaeota archaeon]|nr:hypothetical protein [Candidatus Woesearchaeota archaeon]
MVLKIISLASSLFFSWPMPIIHSVQQQTVLQERDSTVICQEQLEKAYLTADTSEKKDKIAFVRELDSFLRDLNLVKGSAFCNYQKKSVKKAELTVTKRDHQNKQNPSQFYYGTEEEMQKKNKEFIEKTKKAKNPPEIYETYLRTNIQSPDSPLTPEFLQYSYNTIADLFIHERIHDEFNLPLEIEEALCDAAAYHLARDFFQNRMYRNDLVDDIEVRVQGQLQKAKIIIETYETLQELYLKKNITAEDREKLRTKYFSEIRQKLSNPQINDAWLNREMYYHKYFHELYLVPLRMELSLKDMLWWYGSLPTSLEAAEEEIEDWCKTVKCKEESKEEKQKSKE